MIVLVTSSENAQMIKLCLNLSQHYSFLFTLLFNFQQEKKSKCQQTNFGTACTLFEAVLNFLLKQLIFLKILSAGMNCYIKFHL
jgi:hypothetical protein